MDYKNKLKLRLIISISYTVLGLIMAIVSVVLKADEYFIGSFGLGLFVCGAVRIRNYFIITKSEDSIKKHEIAETDERNIMIANKAKSLAFTIGIIIMAIAVIVFTILKSFEIARLISLGICAFILVYVICYFIINKKS